MSTTTPPETTTFLNLMNERINVVGKTVDGLREQIGNLTNQLREAEHEQISLATAYAYLTGCPRYPAPIPGASGSRARPDGSVTPHRPHWRQPQ